jgi:hypothetical protein
MTTVGFIGSGLIGGTVARLAVAERNYPDPVGIPASADKVRAAVAAARC